MPFWINDPVDGKPIQILRETEPCLTQVAYWPVAGQGWDLSMVPPTLVTDPNAKPEHEGLEESASVQWSQINQTWMHDPAVADHISQADWDDMIWVCTQLTFTLIDSYLIDHNTMQPAFPSFSTIAIS